MWIDKLVILFRLYLDDRKGYISSDELFENAVKYGLYEDTEEDRDDFYEQLDYDVDEGRIIHMKDKNGNKTWRYKLNKQHYW